jgi:hypothetical protein
MNRADQEPSAAAYDEARTSKSVPAARWHDGRAALGIKGKLLLAFAGMAPLTGIASAVAWYAFTDVDRSVTRIAAESVVGMAASLHWTRGSLANTGARGDTSLVTGRKSGFAVRTTRRT